MLFFATVLACAVALFRPEHRKIAAALALLLAANRGTTAIVLSPAQSYLLFAAVDFYLALVVLCRIDWWVSLPVTTIGWLVAGVTYGAETPILTHGLAGSITLGAVLLSDEAREATPETAAVVILGLSDLAALYPLSCPRELWAETAGTQAAATWTILAALEIYWVWKLWPPSSSLRPASGSAGS